MTALLIPALFLSLSLMSLLPPLGEAVWLNLPPSTTKCVSEEIQNNIVVLGDYNVVANNRSYDLPGINAKVTSPYGNSIYAEENVTEGRFGFTTTDSGKYLVCFWMHNYHEVVGASINLDWKIGIAAKDWESVARDEKIEGVALELRRHEAIAKSIHATMVRLRSRELVMRKVSETTNDRVSTYSIMSLMICVVVSSLQLWNLKCYFRKKKII
ncbi:PREDICTED: transmembrane emp24 domain-containing protein p24delta3-like [Nelumbo nucifera]|uniref:Transmembrane emp24 domain-containing protein p24delta3-like n=2 Tax=Nelumbo nucifera TaxID=4432 RepID=A0A1U8AXD1_NELNU|nr:PREDICTED: transmembrane emp24 domain-containing protein p24delta3-like [Nelumbo nucifera]DAD39628.1 TPA_asm: hypothetical protein HUJ06_013951 [Nelumbo nucifera]